MAEAHYLDPRIAAAYDAECRRHAVTVDDIPFYVDLACQARDLGQVVLELGCGTGRVTIPIAEVGVTVTGLDSSPAMLAVARSRAPDTSNPTWLQGDMAGFEAGQRFGLALIPFRSFQLLLSVERQRACLAAIREHLLPGGWLAFNLANPQPLLPAAVQPPTRLSDVGAVISRQARGLRLRYVFRSEVELLLAESGFSVEGAYGWFDGRPLRPESSEMVWLARRGRDQGIRR